MSLRAALAIYMSAWVRARRGSVSETGTPRRTCCGQRMDKARTCPGHSRTLPDTRGHDKARRRCRDSARVAYCCAGARINRTDRTAQRVDRRGARWPRTRLGKVAWGCSPPAGVSARIYISRGRASAHQTRTRTRTSTHPHRYTRTRTYGPQFCGRRPCGQPPAKPPRPAELAGTRACQWLMPRCGVPQGQCDGPRQCRRVGYSGGAVPRMEAWQRQLVVCVAVNSKGALIVRVLRLNSSG